MFEKEDGMPKQNNKSQRARNERAYAEQKRKNK